MAQEDDTDDNLRVAILQDEITGNLVLDFGREISWLELSPEEALSLGNEIVKCAEQAIALTKPPSVIN